MKIKEARILLGSKSEKLTDEQVEVILASLYRLASKTIDSIVNKGAPNG